MATGNIKTGEIKADSKKGVINNKGSIQKRRHPSNLVCNRKGTASLREGVKVIDKYNRLLTNIYKGGNGRLEPKSR